MDGTLAINILGWLGVAALLLAYGLISAGKVKGDSVPYQVMNLGGSACVLLNSLRFGAYPSVGVNAVWMVIAGLALARALRPRR
jgi:hypothetical protein